ncbi:MAG: homocysteine biosynthesis protein [Candidatus Omnitrophota bacterium]|nr:homocysteine biosynthesis protein [Candidatus Omnitrophota bacterium]
MPKTFKEINEKIKQKKAVVVTAEEIIDIVRKKGASEAARAVDVVTTGTFGPMCSSGAFLNIGHSVPKIKIQKAWLNDVPCYAGLAAVDLYLGAAEVADGDPLNKIFPGQFKYGGGHVIENLVAGKDVRLEATAYGTSCYPRKKLNTWINIKDLNQAILTNPRNSCQNYNVAVNLHSERIIYTYMGILKPNLGNANYCSAGQLSPLFNDPYCKTIGIGTRIFLGGGTGYVFFSGTQHDPNVKRDSNGIPLSPAGTLAVAGDLKQMSSKWLVGSSFQGYGVNLTVGIGIPIPILDEEIVKSTAVSDEEIFAPIVDYSQDYPQGKSAVIGKVSYKELKSGEIKIRGKTVPTGPLSSYCRGKEIAEILKEQIEKGKFLLGESVQSLSSLGPGTKFRPLNERPIK